MGEHFVPSPQKRGKRGKKRNRSRRTDAAQGVEGRGQQTEQAIVPDCIIASLADYSLPASTPPSIAKSNGSVASQDEANVSSYPKRVSGSASRSKSWVGRNAYAAIDLGTNNCRLLIARPAYEGFTIVDAFSRVVRLGEGMSASGRISDAAMDRAVGALSICAEKLKRRNVMLARSVATEACRQASNGVEFIERVHRETGIRLDIIDPREEAQLAVKGCYVLLPEGDGPALIFDIGGGSTELALVQNGENEPEIVDWVSVPWGVVSLTEGFPCDSDAEVDRLAVYAEMKRQVHESLAQFAARLPKGGTDYRMLGTSGTVTTLASVYLKLQYYDRRQVDGLQVSCCEMRDISLSLARTGPSGRMQYPTIGQDRAELVVAGCAILDVIMDIWPCEKLGVADRGIREGILRGLMDGERRRRPVR
jgi:exopolyphosphatase / guanosine-5'-triphosphate,3'-diphosphate pyrophosphatase